MTEPATVTLDVCGLPCPAPLLGAKKLIDDLQPGQTLRLISDCPGTADDLFSWAKAGAADLVFSHESGRGVHEFYLKKA